MPWCFQCGIEYAPNVDDCLECGVALVEEAPVDAGTVGAPDEDQLAYELHEWAGEARRILDQLLTDDGIAHAWQGATLVVRAADEGVVDELLTVAESTGGPALFFFEQKTAYEMTDWADAEQTAFSDLLARLGIAHEFDEVGDLVVLASDEDAVETAIDAFESGSDDRPELDGLDGNRMMTQVFVACDRLRKDPRDDAGISKLVELAPVFSGHRPPFGIDPKLWDALGERSAGLVDLLAAGDTPEDELTAAATTLTEALRRLV
ncbi:MAG TPA: hypothetical protein QGI23_06580 [Acidimicrobiales bacterium]|nr:hypothetical protein [Acidimicrobiales bacterium]